MKKLEDLKDKLVNEAIPMGGAVQPGATVAQPQQAQVQQVQKQVAQPQAQQQMKQDPKLAQQRAVAKKAKMDQINALKAQIMALQKELASM